MGEGESEKEEWEIAIERRETERKCEREKNKESIKRDALDINHAPRSKRSLQRRVHLSNCIC